MSYQVSARKYRPQTFAEVVGQPHIVRTLSNAIEAGRVAHAYLFSGVRGVGKTTVARVFAKALNCENGPTPTPCNQCEPCRQVTHGDAADVLEIDGASNNGVDAVRDLTDNIRYRPLSCRYKIYIIDEVHMLSTAAFNALLKTLEEPPDHAVFMFATTETHKIPRTILSRCQHHAFRRIARDEIGGHLNAVAQRDGIAAPADAIALLAKAADGSMRDGLSLFDQAVSFGGGAVSRDDLILMLGVVGQETLDGFAHDILGADPASALTRLKQLVDAGHDLQVLVAELVEHFRNLLMCQVSRAPEQLMELPEEDVAELTTLAQAVPQELVQQVLSLLSDAQERCRRALNPRFVLEAALVRAAQAPQLIDLSTLLAKLDGADLPIPTATSRRPLPARVQRPETPTRPTTAVAPTPLTPTPVASAPVASAPVAPASVTPAPVAPAPVAPASVTPAPVAPAPVAPAPVAPAPVAPAPVAAKQPAPAADLPPWQGPPPGDPRSGLSEAVATARSTADREQAPPAPRPEAPPAAPSATPAPPPPTAPVTPVAAIPAAAPPTASSPPAAAPSVATPTTTFDSPNDLWLHVVEEVRSRRAALASYLEQGTLHSATDTRVEIGYPAAYEVIHGMVNRAENVQFITRMAREVSGRDVEVVFSIVSAHQDDVTTLAQEHEAKRASAHQQEIEETTKLPFVKDVLDTFGGEIVELRKPEQ